MKRTISILLAAGLLLSITGLFTACGKEKPQATPEPPAVEEPADTQPEAEEIPFEKGSIENGRYINRWADISFVIPEGMEPLSQEEMMARLENVGKLMAGDDMEAQQQANAHIEEAFVPLFMLDDPDVPGSLKVLLVAEYTQDISSPQEYLEKTLEQLSQGGTEIQFNNDPKEVQLGGHTYQHASLILENGSGISYDVRQIEGGFLVLSIGYGADIELNQAVASFISNISYACPYPANS